MGYNMANSVVFNNIEDVPFWKLADPCESSLFKNDKDHTIPIFRLESWTDFIDFMNTEPIISQLSSLLFRGQENADWELESSLSRINRNYSDKPIEYNLKQEIIDIQLDTFKKHFKSNFTDDQLWAIGQHHGLWTPYLDWTSSFEVALYFGIQSYTPQTKNKYFSISTLNKTKISEKPSSNIIIKEQNELKLSQDSHFHRIINQQGCFTQTLSKPTIEGIISDYNDNKSDYFYKIFIQNKDIHSCIEYLLKKDIDVKYIFPDLEGIVDYCNKSIAKKGVSFGGGTVIKIEQVVLSSTELKNTKELLASFLDKNNSCDLDLIAQDINKLRFDIEKILLLNGFPYEKIESFLKAYLNN